MGKLSKDEEAAVRHRVRIERSEHKRQNDLAMLRNYGIAAVLMLVGYLWLNN